MRHSETGSRTWLIRRASRTLDGGSGAAHFSEVPFLTAPPADGIASRTERTFMLRKSTKEATRLLHSERCARFLQGARVVKLSAGFSASRSNSRIRSHRQEIRFDTLLCRMEDSRNV
ncbi:hypothetical protein M513_08622 [Trichuris suis]|uniref:Uncharacterized protein n=1 Tax=Trichuris suis TaxID=68888 RepID=A0A085M008_9BILA|nr:hypothetical protein M513_08622 [Trichuris suis]